MCAALQSEVPSQRRRKEYFLECNFGMLALCCAIIYVFCVFVCAFLLAAWRSRCNVRWRRGAVRRCVFAETAFCLCMRTFVSHTFALSCSFREFFVGALLRSPFFLFFRCGELTTNLVGFVLYAGASSQRRTTSRSSTRNQRSSSQRATPSTRRGCPSCCNRVPTSGRCPPRKTVKYVCVFIFS